MQHQILWTFLTRECIAAGREDNDSDLRGERVLTFE